MRVHDFPSDARGKAIPYGVYDMARHEAWVSVGRDHDTPAFAVASIRQWWTAMGRRAHPEATSLFITADAGGSNGYRSRAWKRELQTFADETQLRVRVSHFPPGTSKWTHSPLYPTRSMGSGTTNCDPAEVGESKSIKVLRVESWMTQGAAYAK